MLEFYDLQPVEEELTNLASVDSVSAKLLLDELLDEFNSKETLHQYTI